MNQNDLPLEVELHRIGPCPVCGKGQMLQGAAGWTCDYFRTLDDKCTFTIFSSYSNYLLTEEDAVALIRDGRTMKHNFMTQSGKGFVARLVLEDGKVKDVQFVGGCNGNLKGIAALVEGMDVQDVISRIEGVRCGMKPTSCPDQLAKALKEVNG